MEKEYIYSSSLGMGKEAQFYGKWAKRNGAFVQLNKDSWREGTQYWIPTSIPENTSLQQQLIDRLVLSSTFKEFELMETKTILLPVVEVGDALISLSQKYAESNPIGELFTSDSARGYDIWNNFDWEKVDENKLQHHSSSIQPIDIPFIEFQEEVHYRGNSRLTLVNETLNVFFLPITLLMFKYKGEEHKWLVLAGQQSSVAFTPLQIEKDSIFTSEGALQKVSTGCLTSLGLFALGVWLIALIWPKLHGWTLVMCLIGIIAVLYFLNGMLKDFLSSLIDKQRERKIQGIIEHRKEVLARKGLRTV